ncbi:MAG: hypothetical protein A3F14_06230 [Gammaproteobacteria bacterium RIFCSPHIGHO2_12_FULL_43_28]|nr:MAG: hypothetical protein A3F14_06230 [Gammaproteobacteria bacterium RIFCSPHIGHO2_12_FULL_43_28]
MKFITPDWPAPKHIKAYTTTRVGFGELPLPQNEAILNELLKLPTNPIWLTQKHTAICVEATPNNQRQIADASFTIDKNRVCAVLTADCLPILMTDRQGSSVAAIHAGWRGLQSGIIEATVKSLSIDPTELLVWLGPAISPQKFEVGEEVFTAFVSQHAASESAFKPLGNHKWLANLYHLAQIRLKLLNITACYGGDFCTYTQDDLFFSYRRDKGQTGRLVSLIWIES